MYKAFMSQICETGPCLIDEIDRNRRQGGHTLSEIPNLNFWDLSYKTSMKLTTVWKLKYLDTCMFDKCTRMIHPVECMIMIYEFDS